MNMTAADYDLETDVITGHLTVPSDMYHIQITCYKIVVIPH